MYSSKISLRSNMDNKIERKRSNEHEALQKFKRQLYDILTPYDTDAQLMKWLRARNFNLKKAEALFREMYCCRQIYEIDTIEETYIKPEVLEKYEYHGHIGFAKNGTPVRYIAMGRGDNLGFLKSLSGYALCIYSSYVMQVDLNLMRKASEKMGREINEVTYIFDMDGFAVQDNLYKSLIETGLDLGHIVQEYYPEIWSNVFFVNAPTIFDKIFNLFKPVFKLSLLEKVQFVDREHTSEMLLKYIDEDVLPEFLGGKRRDSKGDPKCREFLRFGGKVPEEYFLCHRPLLLTSDPGASSVVIGARSCFNYSVVVRKPGSKLSVEFRTEGASIYIIMLYRKFGPDPNDLDIPRSDEYLDEKAENSNVQLVSPGLRMQSHFAPVEEKCTAPWPGIYIFKFDNTSSWFISKRLIYRIRVLEPES